MRYGYARVSTKEQNIGSQIARLQEAKCEKIVRDDGISGVTISKRPALVALRKKLQSGDQLVVCSLDRLARSMKDLMTMVQEFKERDVQFRSLKENIDTSTPTGKLIFHLFAALAEFEHDLIVERTRAGMRRPGAKKAGRKAKIDQTKIKIAREMIEAGNSTRADIAHALSVDRSTLFRTMRNDRKSKL